MINRFTFQFFRAVYIRVWTLLGIGPTNTLARALVTGLLLTGLFYLATRLLGIWLSPWWYPLPFIYGGYIGWAWTDLDFPRGIWMGTRR